MRPWPVFTFIICSIFCLSLTVRAQNIDDLDIDGEELKLLLDEIPLDDANKDPSQAVIKSFKPETSKKRTKTANKDDQDFLNDLESFKDDFGDLDFGELVIPENDTIKSVSKTTKKVKKTNKAQIPQKSSIEPVIVLEQKPVQKTNVKAKSKKKVSVFDTGKEERELLEISRVVQGKIARDNWDGALKVANRQTYIVQKNDWLFKIARKLFGSGFYYPKIWALNDYITNPHEIEPGMVLVFDTGDAESLPSVKLGSFNGQENGKGAGSSNANAVAALEKYSNFDNFGENAKPPWLDEKIKLLKSGTFFQYATETTVSDLKKLGEQGLVKEYKNYTPPDLNFSAELPESYDENGFDRTSKLEVDYKQGYFLNSFVSTSPVKDFGYLKSAINEGVFITNRDTIYVQLDDINPAPGDEFSLYRFEGKVKHKKSERKGRRYTIVGQIRIVEKKEKGFYSAVLTDSIETVERGDRITVYTPKIEKIIQRFSSRKIEATVVSSYKKGQTLPSTGDVVYLDRGRADGVEVGDLFEIWGHQDRKTEEKITLDPTYKNAEAAVISLSDNFATVLITSARRDFQIGDLAITKSKVRALMSQRMKNSLKLGKRSSQIDQIDNLDIELKLDDLNEDMLAGAERVDFTEDELSELEKLEREKSIIKTSQDELSDLEKLEKQLELTERELTEGKRDQDKLLEGENLDDVEQKQKFAFDEDLDVIEENFGKKYLDEELNKNDNPYGLTEFDIEEVDELLNLDKKAQNDSDSERY